MKTWIAFLVLAVSSAAYAAGDRIVVLAPPGATGVRAQLTDTLCLSEECVPAEQVLSAGKLDLAKVARLHIGSVITGHALTSKKGPELELSVLATSGKAKLTEKMPLNDTNKLAVKDLVTASAKVLAAVDGGEMVKEGTADGAISAHAPRAHKALAHRIPFKASHRLAFRPHTPGARG
jgi:hypothetical protein